MRGRSCVHICDVGDDRPIRGQHIVRRRLRRTMPSTSSGTGCRVVRSKSRRRHTAGCKFELTFNSQDVRSPNADERESSPLRCCQFSCNISREADAHRSACACPSRNLPLAMHSQFVNMSASKGRTNAHLFVAAYEADDDGLFLSSLHPIHGADLQFCAEDWTEQGGQECHLRLVADLAQMAVRTEHVCSMFKRTYGVMTAIWEGRTPAPT